MDKRMMILAGMRVEALILVLLAAALASTRFGEPVMALGLPLLGIAVLLASRNIKVKAREEEQLDIWDDLALRGGVVRSLHEVVEKMPKSWDRSRDFLLAQYQAEKWIDRVRAHLTSYPEFASIFEAHGGQNPMEELEGRIRRLNEIRHLVDLSQKLHLEPLTFRQQS